MSGWDQTTVYVGPMLDPDEIRFGPHEPLPPPPVAMPAWKADLTWMGGDFDAVEFDWPEWKPYEQRADEAYAVLQNTVRFGAWWGLDLREPLAALRRITPRKVAA